MNIIEHIEICLGNFDNLSKKSASMSQISPYLAAFIPDAVQQKIRQANKDRSDLLHKTPQYYMGYPFMSTFTKHILWVLDEELLVVKDQEKLKDAGNYQGHSIQAFPKGIMRCYVQHQRNEEQRETEEYINLTFVAESNTKICNDKKVQYQVKMMQKRQEQVIDIKQQLEKAQSELEKMERLFYRIQVQNSEEDESLNSWKTLSALDSTQEID